jgi:hypothetical protein
MRFDPPPHVTGICYKVLGLSYMVLGLSYTVREAGACLSGG